MYKSCGACGKNRINRNIYSNSYGLNYDYNTNYIYNNNNGNNYVNYYNNNNFRNNNYINNTYNDVNDMLNIRLSGNQYIIQRIPANYSQSCLSRSNRGRFFSC